jgi:hypothetical protein
MRGFSFNNNQSHTPWALHTTKQRRSKDTGSVCLYFFLYLFKFRNGKPRIERYGCSIPDLILVSLATGFGIGIDFNITLNFKLGSLFIPYTCLFSQLRCPAFHSCSTAEESLVWLETFGSGEVSTRSPQCFMVS